jgi:hypothetical protein
MACHAEFLRVALQDEQLSRAVLADPRAVAERAGDPTTRVLAHLARMVTETPWALCASDRRQAHAAGIDDGALLHAVALSAYFGHLNRIADAVGVELDYTVALAPLPAEPATPPYLVPPRAEWPEPSPDSLDLAARPGTASALAAWQTYILEREAPLTRRQRSLIARAVAERLGDVVGAGAHPAVPESPGESALVALADEVTRAPWRLGAATVASLRAAGLEDELAIFDALAVTSSSTTFSRIRVALAALARPAAG